MVTYENIFFIASITNNKQNLNFLRSSFMSIRGGGLAKIMRDAMHGHSSFLMTANVWYLHFSGSMGTSKCTLGPHQHLCFSIITSLHLCDTCLETC